MDFEFDVKDEIFRQEVREFIRENLPEHISTRIRHKSFAPNDLHTAEWHRILAKKGWSVPDWPVEYGGTGWTPLQQYIFDDECCAADAPSFPWGPTDMVGPVIYTFGSKEQKEKFLPMIQQGLYYWCQGFSEPGSGSDLASMRTTAVRDGDKYIVNGQKIWTSGASVAEWGFFLLKTDTTCKPQRGISFLLINMKSPGITVRPIHQIDGDDHLCEVFLDNVEVPIENLIGEEGKGWTYAKYLLDHERTGSSCIFWNKRELQKLKEIAGKEFKGNYPLIQDPVFSAKLLRIEAELLALEWSVLRVLANEQVNWNPTAIASSLKISGSQLQQKITSLQVEALGVKSLRYISPEEMGSFMADKEWPEYVIGKTSVALITRASTIYGGALQVQKNIVAKLAFGL